MNKHEFLECDQFMDSMINQGKSFLVARLLLIDGDTGTKLGVENREQELKKIADDLTTLVISVNVFSTPYSNVDSGMDMYCEYPNGLCVEVASPSICNLKTLLNKNLAYKNDIVHQLKYRYEFTILAINCVIYNAEKNELSLEHIRIPSTSKLEINRVAEKLPMGKSANNSEIKSIIDDILNGFEKNNNFNRPAAFLTSKVLEKSNEESENVQLDWN